MSGAVWRHRAGGVLIEVDRSALSAALAPTHPHLNALAEQVAQGARDVLPNDAMRAFIGVKPAGSGGSSNKWRWPLELSGRRWRGDQLLRDVEVPVALVTNNSILAMVWEYGGVAQRDAKRMVKRGAVKGGFGKVTTGRTRGRETFLQWQPLTLGAQRAAARAVIRYRKPRSAA